MADCNIDYNDPYAKERHAAFMRALAGEREEKPVILGNQPCPCGSELRFDLCCGKEGVA
ncbi:MAG: SEC-C metal-binding domain-containing protein [Desulfobulbaceae bacterium]